MASSDVVGVTEHAHTPAADGNGIDPYELVWCATGGDLSRVSEILTAHPEMVDQGDEDGSTPLIAAAWTNQVEVVDFLLSRKANIDWANKTHGWTALHAAAAKGHARIVETLLKHGANADLPDFHQQLPLMYADFHGHAEVYKLLKEHKNKKLAPADGAKPAGDNRVCAECSIA